jgi:tRNA nucleotidyltransferase (CCA-adding enzyme)
VRLFRRSLEKQIVPDYVARVLDRLSSRYQAFVVGGACRDILQGIAPHDWDVATDAEPGDIAALFQDYSLNRQGEKHGTVTVIERDGLHRQVEVTTFRVDETYTDGRRPDSVGFVRNIREDLARRDFTVNAIAISWPGMEIVDPFEGEADLSAGLIRCVGEPARRFSEDGLRLMRAIRLRAETGWMIEKATYAGIKSQSRLINKISKERIRDELSRILLGRCAQQGLRDLIHTGLLEKIIVELAGSIGFDQKTPHHYRTLDEHIIETVSWVSQHLAVRLAALLHDVAKPDTFSVDEDGEGHFYGHNKLGAEMAAEILRRLKFDKDTIQRVVILVREHMFTYGPGVTDQGIRRLIGRVGKDNIADLFDLRRADILASGGLVDPWLDHTWDRVMKAIRGKEPTGAKDLAVSGRDVMELTGWTPGPRVGRVLESLLEAVLHNPSLNNREKLLPMIRELARQEP